MDRTDYAILILLLIPTLILGSTVVYVYGSPNHTTTTSTSGILHQISEDPIKPSNPTNVVIREAAVYDAPIGDNEPIAHYSGIVYWEELAGSGLGFYVNTSKVINHKFWDFETKKPLNIKDSCSGNFGLETNCVQVFKDRYLIVPSGRSFEYEIDSYYKPDVIKDTGFIVVFNSQSVDFSITVDGQPVYAHTDYTNTIVLPKGAGIVSYAPIDDGYLGPLDRTSDGRYILKWQYIDRAMDSKHDPLMISVTYTYDKIFLAFTDQVYQNQQQQQKRQEEINKLNLIRQSFAIMATLAIILSLFSIFFAYLLARRKFETDLKRAQELPRREVSDIETDPPLKVPVKSLFLSAIIIIPLFFSPVLISHAQTNQTDRVKWNGTYDLSRDFTLTESISMELPTARDFIYIYTDTSVSDLKFYNEFGNELPYETEPNRYRVDNPGLKFSYDLHRPYTVSNFSNMLVWQDRFWLEFAKPSTVGDPNDPFFNVDMSYTVILPQGAYLYSASPSDLLSISTQNGRYHVNFKDTNRQMDAFHDVFETQVTFSFIGIIDALKNLNSDFIQVKPKDQSLQSLVKVAAQEVLIFAILGLIAPLLSFIIAYWVFRRRYQKMIDRAEKDQEEKIFVEGPQIQALSNATSPDSAERLTDAFLGHYYRAMEFLGKVLEMDVERISPAGTLELIRRNGIKLDTQILMEVLNLGGSIQDGDTIGYDQLNELARLVEELIDSYGDEQN